MPQHKRDDGPWGEAIAYCMDHHVPPWEQADIVRAAKGQIDKNTVSRAVNGKDVSTRMLRVIAAALGVDVELVLVSPERKSANQQREQLALEITKRVMRDLEAAHAPPVVEPTPEQMKHRAIERIPRIQGPATRKRKRKT